MSHMPLERIRVELVARGIPCEIVAGAQGRSARRWGAAGYPRGCQTVVEHHTVSSGSVPANDIRYIIEGKGEGYVIANAYTDLWGKVWLTASGPTYTEGAGGPIGLIPADGGNTVAFSNEIASWGAEDSVYSDDQQEAVLALALVAGEIAAELYDWAEPPWHPWRNFAHFEWAPGRKIDPRGISRWSPQGGMWDMDAFRNDIRRLAGQAPPEETDMGQLNYIRLRVRTKDGKLGNLQLMGLSIGNEDALRDLGADDDRMYVATIDATQAEIEAELGTGLF